LLIVVVVVVGLVIAIEAAEEDLVIATVEVEEESTIVAEEINPKSVPVTTTTTGDVAVLVLRAEGIAVVEDLEIVEAIVEGGLEGIAVVIAIAGEDDTAIAMLATAVVVAVEDGALDSTEEEIETPAEKMPGELGVVPGVENVLR